MATVATTIPLQQGPVVVAQAPQANMNVSAIRGLGITQIVFGVLTVIFGIVSILGIARSYWVNASGSGVWFGIWITITGIIGVCSAQNPLNGGLKGTNMGFNIVCTCVSFFVGIFFAIGLGYYSNCGNYRYGGYYNGYYINPYCQNKGVGVAMYAILLILMIAEFFVSLVASVYCCQGSGCCNNQPRAAGIIIQPGYQVATSQQGQTIITSSAYPHAAYPPSVALVGGQPQYFQQPFSQGQVFVPQQPMMSQPGMVSQPGMMAQTTTTYSSDQVPEYQKTAPPPYSS